MVAYVRLHRAFRLFIAFCYAARRLRYARYHVARLFCGLRLLRALRLRLLHSCVHPCIFLRTPACVRQLVSVRFCRFTVYALRLVSRTVHARTPALRFYALVWLCTFAILFYRLVAVYTVLVVVVRTRYSSVLILPFCLPTFALRRYVRG